MGRNMSFISDYGANLTRFSPAGPIENTLDL